MQHIRTVSLSWFSCSEYKRERDHWMRAVWYGSSTLLLYVSIFILVIYKIYTLKWERGKREKLCYKWSHIFFIPNCHKFNQPSGYFSVMKKNYLYRTHHNTNLMKSMIFKKFAVYEYSCPCQDFGFLIKQCESNHAGLTINLIRSKGKWTTNEIDSVIIAFGFPSEWPWCDMSVYFHGTSNVQFSYFSFTFTIPAFDFMNFFRIPLFFTVIIFLFVTINFHKIVNEMCFKQLKLTWNNVIRFGCGQNSCQFATSFSKDSSSLFWL